MGAATRVMSCCQCQLAGRSPLSRIRASDFEISDIYDFWLEVRDVMTTIDPRLAKRVEAGPMGRADHQNARISPNGWTTVNPHGARDRFGQRPHHNLRQGRMPWHGATHYTHPAWHRASARRQMRRISAITAVLTMPATEIMITPGGAAGDVYHRLVAADPGERNSTCRVPRV